MIDLNKINKFAEEMKSKFSTQQPKMQKKSKNPNIQQTKQRYFGQKHKRSIYRQS